MYFFCTFYNFCESVKSNACCNVLRIALRMKVFATSVTSLTRGDCFSYQRLTFLLCTQI